MASRILVIENEKSWLKLLQKNLRATDRTIVETTNLKDARTELMTQSFDLMVVDLNLDETEQNPLASVDDLIRVVRQEVSSTDIIPIVVVTGSEADDKRITRALTNHTGWIWGWHWKMPFEAVDFQRNIERALKMRQEKEGDASGLLRTSLVVFAVILFMLMLVLLLIFQFAMSIAEAQILVGVIVFFAIIVSLLIVAIAYPNRFDAIMPAIERLLGSFRLN